MHWWGVSIDNVVVIFTVIALGLSVDYSVHIAHAFLTSSGTPDERMSKALTEVGPPVLHGALSTFMVVLVLSLSISYVFVIFFRYSPDSSQRHKCATTIGSLAPWTS